MVSAEIYSVDYPDTGSSIFSYNNFQRPFVQWKIQKLNKD